MKQNPVGRKQTVVAKKTDAPFCPQRRTGHLPGHLLGACLLAAFSTTSLAHGIHQHGLAHLEISQQAGTVTVSFRSPLDSLIGFESQPANDEQRALARELLEKLQQAPEAVFRLPPAAGCELSMPPRILAQTLTSADEDTDAHPHGAAHGDHDHDHGHGGEGEHAAHHDGHDHEHDQTHDEHAHDHDHAHQHDHGHDQDEPHDHDARRHDHGDSSHSDLSADYQFSCRHPGKIRSIQLTVFQNWPRIHTVDTAVVSDHGQKAARLKAHQSRLSW